MPQMHSAVFVCPYHNIIKKEQLLFVKNCSINFPAYAFLNSSKLACLLDFSINRSSWWIFFLKKTFRKTLNNEDVFIFWFQRRCFFLWFISFQSIHPYIHPRNLSILWSQEENKQSWHQNCILFPQFEYHINRLDKKKQKQKQSFNLSSWYYYAFQLLSVLGHISNNAHCGNQAVMFFSFSFLQIEYWPQVPFWFLTMFQAQTTFVPTPGLKVSYFFLLFLLFGVSPTFSYFRVKFLLFPTFLGFRLN